MSKKPIELTPEQRRLAEQYEKEQQAKLSQQQVNLEKRDKMQQEAVAVAKYLMGLGMKMSRTQLIVDAGQGKRYPVNCEYVIGKNLHFTIMTHKTEILKLCKTMDSHRSLNGLASITDSCSLVMGLISLGAMNRVIPNRL